jgi:hypothetical protein
MSRDAEWYVPEKISYKRIVVSLSTIPSRIQNINKVIDSILQSDIQPDLIYLNIPKISKKENKPYFTQGNLHPKVFVNIVEEDYGPITKLYPTLLKETDDDTIIICVDDDKEYDKKLIPYLVNYSHKYPDSCICVSGWNYFNLLFVVVPYLNIRPVGKIDILQCYLGVLYKRKFFKNLHNLTELMSLKMCFTTDDIIISKFLEKEKIDIIAVRKKFNHKDIETSIKLSDYNLTNNQWVKCINEIKKINN